MRRRIWYMDGTQKNTPIAESMVLLLDAERVFDALDEASVSLVIQGLPPGYQKIMRMRYVQSLSLSEMAQSTGRTKNAVVAQVLRGLVKLRLFYAPARV